jgi:hypothetical protein
MTKQATLGPIDPTLTGPLNPVIVGGAPDARAPVSVEAVNGFIELGKANMGTADVHAIKHLILKLAENVHPLVLGEAFRSKAQIAMLGRQLLQSTAIDGQKIEPILNFLCSESGSHDYSMHRREAIALGLPVEKPDQEFYAEIKELYDHFSKELELTNPWKPFSTLPMQGALNYSLSRALLQSTTGGSYRFVTKGLIDQVLASKVDDKGQTLFVPMSPPQFQDRRTFEGWIYESH